MKPIFITGCARSGTSLVARCIHSAGAAGGELVPGNIHNKYGYFENAAVRETVIKPALIAAGLDPLGQNPLPDFDCPVQAPNLRRDVLRIMLKDSVDLKKPWFYKCAKLPLMWQAWAQSFPEAKYIIVRRKDADIVDTCMKTPFMRNRQTEEEWQEWVDYHKRAFTSLMESDLDVMEVWADNLIDGDLTQIERAIEWAGLSFDRSAIAACIDPSIWTRSKE